MLSLLKLFWLSISSDANKISTLLELLQSLYNVSTGGQSVSKVLVTELNGNECSMYNGMLLL